MPVNKYLKYQQIKTVLCCFLINSEI